MFSLFFPSTTGAVVNASTANAAPLKKGVVKRRRRRPSHPFRRTTSACVRVISKTRGRFPGRCSPKPSLTRSRARRRWRGVVASHCRRAAGETLQANTRRSALKRKRSMDETKEEVGRAHPPGDGSRTKLWIFTAILVNELSTLVEWAPRRRASSQTRAGTDGRDATRGAKRSRARFSTSQVSPLHASHG